MKYSINPTANPLLPVSLLLMMMVVVVVAMMMMVVVMMGKERRRRRMKAKHLYKHTLGGLRPPATDT